MRQSKASSYFAQILSVKAFLVAALLFSSSCVQLPKSHKEQCLENRATLDIGSGSSKILIATVNTCVQKIEKILFQDSKSLKLKEIMKSHNDIIPKPTLNQAIKMIQDWQKAHQKLKIASYEAVATEVFRQAKNGQEFIISLSKATEIPIRIIDQTEEAKLGFWAAIALSQNSVHEALVWDIGGGSMQMVSYTPEGSYLFYMGKIASVSFKDQILALKAGNPNATSPTKTATLQSPSKNTLQSPNPLGKKMALEAVALAKRAAQAEVPANMKTEAQKKQIVGIGGVLSKSILNQVQKHRGTDNTVISQKDIEDTLLARADLSDKDIQSAYPETDITNLALVLGFMQGLNISHLQSVSADLTAGVLLMSLAPPSGKK